MVGENMVLAEFVKFKHGLYKSCGIEWFESIMLEPRLLQPCFHVAGKGSGVNRGQREHEGSFRACPTKRGGAVFS